MLENTANKIVDRIMIGYPYYLQYIVHSDSEHYLEALKKEVESRCDKHLLSTDKAMAILYDIELKLKKLRNKKSSGGIKV